MLGNVFIKDTDGNIPYTGASGNEKVTGLLFDVSLQPELFTAGYGKNNENNVKLNDVLYITSRKSAVKDFGIIERVKATEDEENNANFFHGIPYYHISEFFRLSGNIDGNGRLYVMFADCSVSWVLRAEPLTNWASGRNSRCGNSMVKEKSITGTV